MILNFRMSDQNFYIDTHKPLDISIPLNFSGKQPNHFDAAPSAAYPMEGNGFVGDTRRGGSCNVDTLQITPHCNGTHTECAGHLTNERLSVQTIIKDPFVPATLITVQPQKALEVEDHYQPDKCQEDQIITAASLKLALQNYNPGFLTGLIIRTLPNSQLKKSRKYSENSPAFLSLEAISFITRLPVKHLLIDLPSVDRMFDKGQLNAHHIFWNMPLGSHTLDAKAKKDKTITEMIFVENEISDGHYILNIQIPNFILDAAPSRVFLFEPVKTK